MENKHVGWLVLGISVIVVGIIGLFNRAMRQIVSEGCPIAHNSGVCPAYGTIMQQTYLSLAIVGIMAAIGLFLIFSKPATRVIVRRAAEKRMVKINPNEYNREERVILGLLRKNTALFQADIVEKTGFAKVKVTRILDKLEARGIIERKRRGMHNLVVFTK